jgi:hypothetical protein
MKPMYCAKAGSLNPNDIPMTAKKVPAGVPEITSTITRRPDCPCANETGEGAVQYKLFLVVSYAFHNTLFAI